MFVRRRRDTTMSVKHAEGSSVLVTDLASRWWAVIWHPGVRAFERQRAEANWPAVWLGLSLLAIIEALGVAYVLYGPTRAAGYSSLPIGPKAHLPQTPLLPLAALLGSVAQFLLIAGLLHLSARLFGGRGSYRVLAYLLALGWVPLMGLSDLVELVPAVGAWLAVLLRLCTLCLCVVALAAAERLTLPRAWAAMLVPMLAGLSLGLVTLALLWPVLAHALS